MHPSTPPPTVSHILTHEGRGQPGTSELDDLSVRFSKPKRRSNSSSMAAGHSALKTKFEAIDDQEAIEYDEDIHGPGDADLEKMSTTSSSADTIEEEGENNKEVK